MFSCKKAQYVVLQMLIVFLNVELKSMCKNVARVAVSLAGQTARLSGCLVSRKTLKVYLC